MEMRSVESSNVRAVGYDAETRTLRVEYKGGGVYEYPNVEPSLYADLLAAESVGKFCHQHVKRLPFKKL